MTAFFINTIGPEDLAFLRDPLLSLPACAKVVDQENEGEADYDPFAITEQLQATILAHASNPPRTESGHVKWLSLLGYRQGGKSTTGELAYYPAAAYNEGWAHFCIADNDKRADELHERLQFCHQRWPESLRPPIKPAAKNETRQITFEHGSRMRVLSGASNAAGVGLSFSSLHASEVAYWKDASRQFSIMFPAMVNRKNAQMLIECTPTPMHEPSAEWWKDQYMSAKHEVGRNIAAFFPFWDGLLNRRPWPKDASLDIEEQRLLDKFAAEGLMLENLAFRRFMMDQDPEIRRNPDLFSCYYPFDDSSCWLVGGKQVIPSHAIQRHTKLGGNTDLKPWKPGFSDVVYYLPFNPNAVYCLMADPAGFAGRDHAAFHIFEVWQDEWKQAATFAAPVDPNVFVDYMLKAAARYGNPVIVVEANYGAATIALLRKAGYPHIYHDWTKNQPGVWKSSDEEFIAILTTALLDKLTLYDQDTVDQISGYRNDKAVQRSTKAETLAPRGGGRRRDRHHWDKVSALMVGCVAMPKLPVRFKPAVQPTNLVVHPASGMTWNEMMAYDKRVAEAGRRAQGSRVRYTRTRRRS